MSVATAHASPRRDSGFGILGALEGRVGWALELECLGGEAIQSLVPWKGAVVVTSSRPVRCSRMRLARA